MHGHGHMHDGHSLEARGDRGVTGAVGTQHAQCHMPYQDPVLGTSRVYGMTHSASLLWLWCRTRHSTTCRAVGSLAACDNGAKGTQHSVSPLCGAHPRTRHCAQPISAHGTSLPCSTSPCMVHPCGTAHPHMWHNTSPHVACHCATPVAVGTAALAAFQIKTRAARQHPLTCTGTQCPGSQARGGHVCCQG